MNKEQAIAILSKHRDGLHDYQVNALYLFGSVVRGESRPDSDVDILVELHPEATIGLFGMVKLKQYLSDLLGCDADIVTPDAIHPMMKKEIIKEIVRAA